MKEAALARLLEPDDAVRRDMAPDSLMAFLNTLRFMHGRHRVTPRTAA